ncbi:MAG: hypothetical protein M1347_06235 [Chloroflexi bacterium]|nr:hypothetical protein [Chloroflexota bacterium]
MSYHSNQDPEKNLPDWLKALRRQQSKETPQPKGAKSEPPKPAAQEPDEEEPNWLREIRERYGRPETKQETPGTEETESPLSDTQPIPASRAVETRPKPSKPKLAEEPPAEEPVIAEPQAETPQRDFPDWLDDLGEPEVGEEKQEEGADTHIPAFPQGSEELTPGELPSWLQAIRPGGAFPQEDTRSGEMLPGVQETAGPLAGLSDVLTAEPEAIQSVKPPIYSARLELTDSQSRHVAAFKKLLDEEGRPKEDLGRRAALPARLLNSFLGAALILAVLLPLLNQSQLVPRPEPDFLPESAEVFNRIDTLPAAAPVLIAFDLQPTLYGETKAAASAVFAHLLDRQARLVFISTQPTGPAVAERLLQEELATLPAIATGDYTNLGYLSGGMAALRSFLSDPRSAALSVTALGMNPWTSSTLESINSVSNFALVVIVSSNADDARIWIEQGAAELPNGLIAVTSAQAAPLLRPYLLSQPQTLQGLVSGVQGAVFYERLRSLDGTGRAMWDSYSYGLGAILLLILLGGLYGRLIHMRPEKETTTVSNRAN